MKTISIVSTIALTCCSVFFACKKEQPAPAPSPAQPTPVFVRMTDAPGPYTAVNVDIQGVELTGNGKSVTLNVSAGIYNLVDFSSGVDTLIATGSVDIERIQQIRLILGPNNSVVSGGTTFPLSTPSAQQSGLKLQVHKELQAGVAYNILLDFDANQSIVAEGNGKYSLKPVIRTIESALSGAIKGQIQPAGVAAVVTASSTSGVYSTNVLTNGIYLLPGLPAGSYSLTVTPVTPYNTATLSAIPVTTGSTTSTGTLNI